MVVEEFLSLHELSDVDEFVYDVEVEICEFAVVQVVGADAEVSILVADAHVASPACEFNLQVMENFFRLVTEDASDGFDVLEVLEVVFEGILNYLGVSHDFDLQFRNRYCLPPRVSYCERVVSEKCCPESDGTGYP